MTPPLLLLPETWERHGYTLQDVLHSFESLNPVFVWNIALLYLHDKLTIELLAKHIFPRASETPRFTHRRALVETLVTETSPQTLLRNRSILCRSVKNHTPLLPQHEVDANTFEYLRHATPSEPPALDSRTRYSACHRFNGVLFLPTEHKVSTNTLILNRVMRLHKFKANPYKSQELFCNQRVVVCVNGCLYVLLDEACVVVTRSFAK